MNPKRILIMLLAITLSFSAIAEGVVYRKGDRGDEVKAIQERLHELGYLKSIANGAYENITVQAVYSFEGINGFYRDGEVSEDEYSFLQTDEAKSYHQFDHTLLKNGKGVYQYDSFEETWVYFSPNAYSIVENDLLSEEQQRRECVFMAPIMLGTEDGVVPSICVYTYSATPLEYTKFAIKVNGIRYYVEIPESNINCVSRNGIRRYMYAIYAGEQLLTMIEDVAEAQRQDKQAGIELRLIAADNSYRATVLKESNDEIENVTALDCRIFVDEWGQAGGYENAPYIGGNWQQYSSYIETEVNPVTVK